MDRKTAHPSFTVPIKRWWKDVYDHAFIAPYPFFRIRSQSHSNSAVLGFEKTLLSDDHPDDFDDIIKRRGEPIHWREVHKSVAPDVSKVRFYRAVWLLSCLGYQERGDISLQKKIDDYCELNRIYLPEEDCLPAIFHPLLQHFLASFGGVDIVGLDEFREHRVKLPLAALGREEPTFYLPEGTTNQCLWAIHVPDPGVLITSQFDGTEALIAMTDSALKIANPERFLEIEKVDNETYCDWLNPVDFVKRDK